MAVVSQDAAPRIGPDGGDAPDPARNVPSAIAELEQVLTSATIAACATRLFHSRAKGL